MARTDPPRASACCQGDMVLPMLLLAASCTVIVAEGRQLDVGMVMPKINTVVFGGDVTRGAPGETRGDAVGLAVADACAPSFCPRAHEVTLFFAQASTESRTPRAFLRPKSSRRSPSSSTTSLPCRTLTKAPSSCQHSRSPSSWRSVLTSCRTSGPARKRRSAIRPSRPTSDVCTACTPSLT
jgi:hypothetical protein